MIPEFWTAKVVSCEYFFFVLFLVGRALEDMARFFVFPYSRFMLPYEDVIVLP